MASANDGGNPLFREDAGQQNGGHRGGSYNSGGNGYNNSGSHNNNSWDDGRPKPLRVFENHVLDFRKSHRQFDADGRRAKIGSDKDCEVFAVSSSVRGAKASLEQNTSIMSQIRCAGDRQQNLMMNGVLESFMTVVMPQEKFGPFVHGMLSLYKQLNIDAESLEEFLDRNYPSE